MGGRRAGAGLLPAAPEGRMSLAARVAPPRYLLGRAPRVAAALRAAGQACARSGPSSAPWPARLAARRGRRADRRRGGGGGQRGPVPVRRVRDRPREGQLHRDLPGSGGGGRRGRAGHRQRVQHRDDQAVADRDAPAADLALRQGRGAHRPGAHRLCAGGRGRRARRAADPARPRLHPRARVRVPHRGRRHRGPPPARSCT